VKTSAHPSPQVDQTQPGLLPEPSQGFTGVLIADAQARTKACDKEGHMVPVLCLDVELDCEKRNRLRAEQRFAPGQHAACQAAAQRLRKGMRVTVEHLVEGICLFAPNTAHIRVHQPSESTA
jgi:hypothetical protein